MSLSVGSIKIIDSYNYLPMPLSTLPKAFDMKEKCKGYFPHLFNTAKNWDYVGPMPDSYFYNAAAMKKNYHDTFMKWYLNQRGKVYIF